MGRKSIYKGANYERDICRRFSRWVTAMEREDVFWRSIMSGGRATISTKKGEIDLGKAYTSGDICAIRPEGHFLLSQFTVECKNYASFGIEVYLYGGQSSQFVKCWAQALDECRKRTQPLMCMKESRRGELMVTTWAGYEKLLLGVPRNRDLRVICHFPDLDAVMFQLRDVLVAVDVAKMKRAIKRKKKNRRQRL
jgi:hypothetical protein